MLYHDMGNSMFVPNQNLTVKILNKTTMPHPVCFDNAICVYDQDSSWLIVRQAYDQQLTAHPECSAMTTCMH